MTSEPFDSERPDPTTTALNTTSLERIGWSSFFQDQIPALPSVIPGRVASANHGRFLVWTAARDTGYAEVDASVSGLLRKSGALWPAVGDWVLLRTNEPVIDRVLIRKTCVSRKQPEREIREQILAANIDVLFIVSGLDRDYNPRRIERYLVMANESGARPVVLLNKSDLATELALDLDDIVTRTQLLSPAITVIPISALSDHGLEALPAQLAPGQTAALIGSSGVGKSTILNRLLGQDLQATMPVRSSDSRGRHTTTSRQLFLMPGGWLLMDLPGLREVQLWASPNQQTEQLDSNLEATFDDIHQLAQTCRFRDCTHTAEPGCAVLAATLDPARLANFKKMQRELTQLDRKTHPAQGRTAKSRPKSIDKSTRNHQERDSS